MCTGSILCSPLPWEDSGSRRSSGNCNAARSCPGTSHVCRRQSTMTEMHADSTSTYPGHETRDFSMRVVVLFGACLAVLLAGTLALMAWLFDVFNVTPAGQGLRGAPVAATPP